MGSPSGSETDVHRCPLLTAGISFCRNGTFAVAQSNSRSPDSPHLAAVAWLGSSVKLPGIPRRQRCASLRSDVPSSTKMALHSQKIESSNATRLSAPARSVSWFPTARTAPTNSRALPHAVHARQYNGYAMRWWTPKSLTNGEKDFHKHPRIGVPLDSARKPLFLTDNRVLVDNMLCFNVVQRPLVTCSPRPVAKAQLSTHLAPLEHPVRSYLRSPACSYGGEG